VSASRMLERNVLAEPARVVAVVASFIALCLYVHVHLGDAVLTGFGKQVLAWPVSSLAKVDQLVRQLPHLSIFGGPAHLTDLFEHI